jgi:hypothetical protein
LIVAALQISDSDRSRRDKLVGMLGSSFDGERLNALAMLQKMADTHKVPIHELLLGAENDTAGSVFDRQRAEQAERRAREAELRAQRAEQRTRSDEPAPDAPELPPGWWPHFVEVQELNRSRFFLTSWETNFVSDLIALGTRRSSPKQALIILRILNKAKAFDAASADSDWEDAP